MFKKAYTLLVLAHFSLSPLLFAAVHPKETEADAKIQGLFEILQKKPAQNFTDKLAQMSAAFLGMPYLLGALGEGLDAPFDQFPRYRTDSFDCETYVTTALALSLAQNAKEFPDYLRKIRYKNGKTDYIMRNHFTDLDWNLNNAKNGFVEDITTSIRDENHQVLAQTAEALINKPSWYQYHKAGNIRLTHSKQELVSSRLAELREKGKSLEKIYSRLPYLPFSALFQANGEAKYFVFSQIPDGAIVEIVRPNWDLEKAIGTRLNVSHLGFVFWDHGTLLFRQASSQYGHVVDLPLIDYLRAARDNATIQGINIQKPLPPRMAP